MEKHDHVDKIKYNRKNIFQSKSGLIFLLIIIIMVLGASMSAPAAAENGFWQNQLQQARSDFEESGSLVDRYRLAISRANTGKLWETYEMVEDFEDNFDLEKLEEKISFELRLAKLGSKNVLYLNYAAFYYSIKEEYRRSVEYFDKIIAVEENNIWPYNYKAIILIEELEEYDEALETLQKALEIRGNDYSYLLKGLAYYRQGNYLRSANSLRKGRSTLRELEERLNE